MLHELLHFKRKDIMINWLTQVLVIIHWFNPLIWYAFYRMREDQEIACDALAMDRINTKQSNDYAYTLIKLVETYSKTPRLIGLATLSGSKSQIKRRITMIKEFRKSSVKWSSIIQEFNNSKITRVRNLDVNHTWLFYSPSMTETEEQ
nr:M56 family metallopeptidase [Desulfosporosinus sp. I2]